MTGQAESERHLNVTVGVLQGRAGNIRLADDIFSENVRTMESPSAWPGLVEGYENGSRASRPHRHRRGYVLGAR